MIDNKETKLAKLNRLNSSFWTWAVKSWYTRMVTGICLIIIVLRLATTCVDMFGVRIGCNNNSYNYFEQLDEQDKHNINVSPSDGTKHPDTSR